MQRRTYSRPAMEPVARSRASGVDSALYTRTRVRFAARRGEAATKVQQMELSDESRLCSVARTPGAPLTLGVTWWRIWMY
jgi:hypothetical protein